MIHPLPIELAGQLHNLFETMALVVGAYLYRRTRGKTGLSIFKGPAFAIVMGCLIGAGIGNKAAFWIERPDLFAQHVHQVADFFFAGQSVIGGLVGGLIGVEIAKLITHQKASTGDAFVVPILVGLMIGRIGCFLAGLHDDTYGLATSLPWGVDFGDGIARHPTQLYDLLLAALGLALFMRYRARLAAVPGLGFKLMLASYVFWRLLVDSIKPIIYTYPLGLSGLQWMCLVFLVVYIPLTVREMRKLP